MAQFILLGSYFGPSDFVYAVSCSGRSLTLDEAKEKNLVDVKTLWQHQRSQYSQEWFEINPGDWIEVKIVGDDYSTGSAHMRFVIPPGGLPNPPHNLNDDARTGNQLHEYLMKHCRPVQFL